MCRTTRNSGSRGHAKNKLTTEKVYWISTASPQGRPHAAPVLGIWTDNGLYFETDRKSAKGKNLSSNPRLVVHVQDGMDTVIVEGNATEKRGVKSSASLEDRIRESIVILPTGRMSLYR